MQLFTIIHSFLTTSLSTTMLNLLKPKGTVFNLSISTLSTLALKFVKSGFAANLDVSNPVAFF